MDRFVNRTNELSRLQTLYESDNAELAVIFGRRLRKTALVKQSLKEYDDAILYQAKQKTSDLQLEQFIDVAANTDLGVMRIRERWEDVLGYLVEQDAIIVLDEFPYLVEQDESLPSVLQVLFDYRDSRRMPDPLGQDESDTPLHEPPTIARPDIPAHN